jgi:hypothetical protein
VVGHVIPYMLFASSSCGLGLGHGHISAQIVSHTVLPYFSILLAADLICEALEATYSSLQDPS